MKPAKFDSTTMNEQTFIPPTMRAVYFSPPSTLTFDTDFPTPNASASQYLIKVSTAAFPAWEPLSPPLSTKQIPLHSFCGTIISTPVQDHPSGPRFKLADEVIGLLDGSRDGAAADYVLALDSELAFKPRNLTAAEAATIPFPGSAAWRALFHYANPASGASAPKGKPLRVLVTNAYESEIALMAIRLLRTPREMLVPGLLDGHHHHQSDSTGTSLGGRRRSSSSAVGNREIWICATCGSSQQENFLRRELNLDEVLVLGSGGKIVGNRRVMHTDLLDGFRSAAFKPVDLVLDCSSGDDAGETFAQAHSGFIVKEGGTVLCCSGTGVGGDCSLVGDDEKKQRAVQEEIKTRGVKSRVVAVRPEEEEEDAGRVLDTLRKLVEEGMVRGRVERVVDLVNAGEVMEKYLGDYGDGGQGRTGGMVVVRVNQ